MFQDLSHTSISRRSFLLGGLASASAAALGITSVSLTGCKTSTNSKNYNGEIRAALAYTSSSCKPIANTSALFCAAGWHVFESLYEIDFSDYSNYNGLAVGEPIKNSDTSYTVNMRPNAKYSDGTTVVAADVVNAFNQNLKDSLYGENLDFMKSMTAIDDTTLNIELKYKFTGAFKERLSMIKVYPASSSDSQLKTNPIGSGPWKYVSIDGNDGGQIIFEPNPHYTGPRPAQANRMVWDILLDDTSRTTAIMEQTDKVIENVPVTNTDLVSSSGAEVEFKPSLSMAFLAFNCRKEPFTDKRVRQAIFYAVDTDKLIHNQMSDFATPASCLLQTTHPNYNRASNVFEHNPDKAKSLLDQAGVKNLEFTLLVNNNWVKSLGSQVKNDLEKIGVTCNLEVAPIVWSKYNKSDNVLPFDAMLTPGDPSCFGNDPDVLITFWYGDNSWTTGRTCYQFAPNSRWEEIDNLLMEARTADDKNTAQEKWNKVYDIISDEVPLYPLFHRLVPTGYTPQYLENFKAISTTGLYLVDCKAKTEE